LVNSPSGIPDLLPTRTLATNTEFPEPYLISG
jgi:hypothetical protein